MVSCCRQPSEEEGRLEIEISHHIMSRCSEFSIPSYFNALLQSMWAINLQGLQVAWNSLATAVCQVWHSVNLPRDLL